MSLGNNELYKGLINIKVQMMQKNLFFTESSGENTVHLLSFKYFKLKTSAELSHTIWQSIFIHNFC